MLSMLISKCYVSPHMLNMLGEDCVSVVDPKNTVSSDTSSHTLNILIR